MQGRATGGRAWPGGRQGKRVREILKLLYQEYGSPLLGNKTDPLEELVFISLTRQTHEKNAARTWRALRRAYPSWKRLYDAPCEEVMEVIKDGGFSRQKALWIRAQLERIRERFGRFSLKGLARLPDEEVERFLVSLPGVQIKTARCVMMYALGRDVLPADTHVLRVSERLGLIAPGLTSKAAHVALDRVIPKAWRYRYHVACVLHGREICQALRPVCRRCLVLHACPFGKRATRRRKGAAADGEGTADDQPLHGGRGA